MIFLELLPIGTCLTILTNEILKTALAAQDVLMEKDTFKSLSTYFHSMHPVLNELMSSRDMADTPASRQALEALRQDVEKAKSLVNMCGKKSRFYQLVHCRSIVKEAQQITQDLGKSLGLLSLATAEVSMDIQNNVDKLKDEMMHAEYRASNQKLEIVNKIEMGIRQHKTDQAFLNDLIHEIARSVGVPVEDSSEIRKELEYFKKEKEEAAERKEREEEAFMEQIIALLSRAEATRTPESIREDYKEKKYLVNVDIEQEPLESFRCPLTREVMQDPVSIATGSTFERENIEEWFASGNKTDPTNGAVLVDLNLKPNYKIRECIEEWIDWNHCFRIQNARRKLESGEEAKVNEALDDLCKICKTNKFRHWIAEEKLIKHVVEVLKIRNDSLRRKSLSALQVIVIKNEENKKQLVDAGGVGHVVQCLSMDTNISKIAIALLVELLKADSPGISSQSSLVLEMLSQEADAIPWLVALCNGVDAEAAQNAEDILTQLADKNENIVEMAKLDWLMPLLERLQYGSEQSKRFMAKALSDLELTHQSMESLGKGGVITLLVEMMMGNLENKAASLGALQNLVTYEPNKQRLAQTGAVPIILDHLYSLHFPSNIRESAAAILQQLVSNNDNAFLIDENGDELDLNKILRDLLMRIQDNFFSNSQMIQKQVMLTLLGFVSPRDAHETRKIFSDAHGVMILLPFLKHGDVEIRNVVVQILYCMLGESGDEICHFIMTTTKLIGLFSMYLDEGVQEEVQAAAVGILSRMPVAETNLTLELMEQNVLPMLLHHIRQGSPNLKENAMGALLRFTLPLDIQIQKKVVDLGIFQALRGLIKSGTTKAKIRAAIALRNLSESTMQLSIPRKLSGCFFCILKKPPTVCRVHGGECGERTTFCLIEANVVSDLVSLLKASRGSDVAGASVEALSTLLPENENLEKGVLLLRDEGAIQPILGLISHGTDSSKEKAVNILRKIFKVKAMREIYGGEAQIHLAPVATHAHETLAKQAAEILATMRSKGSSILF